MQLKKTKHCKYNINYHLVWCPKYRHRVRVDNVAAYVKTKITNICERYNYDLLAVEIMLDHIHLFISAPHLKKQKFWGSGLWSDGYYVGTAGTVTSETIRKYIQEQKCS